MSVKRKQDHIELALQSRIGSIKKDDRFHYEPLLQPHPENILKPFQFLDKTMRVPIWVSSMTGGTEYAGIINKNLARACNEFGMGMGLGSCRTLLEDNTYFDHFNLRHIIGNDQPFYANLGIVQVEKALKDNQTDRIVEIINQTKTDGLIIHVNPIQEWLQPEGDHLEVPPIETISNFLDKVKIKIIVKEVGQGIGPKSLKALLKLNLEAIEFSAFGGTNFAKVELLRSNPIVHQMFEPLSLVGEDAYEMLDMVNHFVDNGNEINVKHLIISGGIHNFLDGYYFIKKSKIPAIYGQASEFLKYARGNYENLKEYVQYQIEGLKLANAYFSIKE